MQNRSSTLAWLAAAGLIVAGCSSDNGSSDANGNPVLDGSAASDGATSADASSPTDSSIMLDARASADAAVLADVPIATDGGASTDGPAEGSRVDGAGRPPEPDAGRACCPAGFLLYDCQEPDGGTGFACHNPALGCASSLICGHGCDPQVSGRCACVQTELCIIGDHFDKDLCKCVPNLDAGARDAALPDAAPKVDAACIDNVLCVRGDHFDTTLCRCVPDTTSCSTAAECTGPLPALCRVCSDGTSGCAHFACVRGQCTVAYCP